MSQKNKNRGLGRGLSSLMSDVVAQQDNDSPQADTGSERPSDRRIPIEKIHPNPDQPRRNFNSEALQELTNSIKAKGIIQPLIVRERREGDYEIVAGERRWRAAQAAGLHDVPVLIRGLSDTEVLEFAIIENIQRSDLNAIDEAAGYRQLMDRFGHTQDQVASGLGKSRSHIANLLRLLSLPDSIQTFVVEGKLSAGHARALIGHENAEEIARDIIRNGLSVRETEKRVKASAKPKQGRKNTRSAEKDADTKQIEQELAAQLRMGVSINHASGEESGSLTIKYKDLAQLDDLLRLLSGS